MKPYLARILQFLLVFSMVASSIALASCGGEVAEGTPSDSESTPVEEAADEYAMEVKDFDGRDYRMFIRTEFNYEFNVEEETGETLNDALYARDLAIEERYDINIQTIMEPSEWGVHEDFMRKVLDLVVAGDKSFDIVAGYAVAVPIIISENAYYDLNDMPYIDLTKEWWSQGLVDTFNIKDTCFVMSGSLALSLWENIFALYFNKAVAEDNSIEGLYDTVRDYKWTYDKLKEYSAIVSADANGDSVYDDQDRYGLITFRAPEFGLFSDMFDMPITSKNDQGLPEFTVDSEKGNSLLVDLNNYLFIGHTAFWIDDYDVLTRMFKADQSLFTIRTLGYSTELRDMESDFGILPFPMYDENQGKYYTTSKDNYTMFAIPNNIEDPEFVGMITEALCRESHKTVVPVFYDTVLKDRNARDEDTFEMIDIVYDGLHFDFAYAHSLILDWGGHIYQDCIRDQKLSISAEWASRKDALNLKLEEVLKIYTEQ